MKAKTIEKIIREWVAKNYGESEAENPSWDIVALAHTLTYQPKQPKFGVIATSKLAGLEIADKDYTEGEKKHFTFEEALKIEEKMKGTGWRLPTRHEWALVCEEFANDDEDVLRPELLEKKLGLKKHGIVSSNSPLYYPGQYAYYWSRSSYSSALGFSLYFNSSYVCPSYYYPRYYGMSVRLVREVKERNKK